MDQKRLFLAIAISVVILLGFQMLLPAPKPVVPPAPVAGAPTAGGTAIPAPSAGPAPTAALGAPSAGVAAGVPKDVPRLKIAGTRVEGSISLLGARIDKRAFLFQWLKNCYRTSLIGRNVLSFP